MGVRVEWTLCSNCTKFNCQKMTTLYAISTRFYILCNEERNYNSVFHFHLFHLRFNSFLMLQFVKNEWNNNSLFQFHWFLLYCNSIYYFKLKMRKKRQPCVRLSFVNCTRCTRNAVFSILCSNSTIRLMFNCCFDDMKHLSCQPVSIPFVSLSFLFS